MRYQQVADEPRTFAVILQTGDELAETLKKLAEREKLADASFKGIGAFSSVSLAWFNPETNKYDTSVDLQEQVELLSLIGDVATYEGKPKVHAHVVVGRRDGTAHGGHLQKAVIHPTCEIFLTESPAHLSKKVDAVTGLALIALDPGKSVELD